MTKYFDKAFFHFLGGFILILAVSFAMFYVVGLYANNAPGGVTGQSQECCAVQQYAPGVQK